MIAARDGQRESGERILHAVIGAWHRGERTFYVQRSNKMKNYPGAWSLFSIQYAPEELPDSLDLDRVQRVMERMSAERLHAAPVRVRRFLTASTCTHNPIDMIVSLRLYDIEFESEPSLNPDYYVDSAWMSPVEYLQRCGNATCGSCMRMWSDYCYKHRLCEFRFAPRLLQADETR